jgi:hypothetical protein
VCWQIDFVRVSRDRKIGLSSSSVMDGREERIDGLMKRRREQEDVVRLQG